MNKDTMQNPFVTYSDKAITAKLAEIKRLQQLVGAIPGSAMHFMDASAITSNLAEFGQLIKREAKRRGLPLE